MGSTDLLNKIISLATELRIKLTEAGLSSQEILNYFACKIFKVSTPTATPQNSNTMLKQQILALVAKAKEDNYGLENLLRDVLTQLQIENGFIEEYENYVPECLPVPRMPKRQTSLSCFDEPPPRLEREGPTSIWETLEDSSPSNSKMPQRLSHFLSFERELNDSLKKTKMLKQLIHKRLVEELEEGQLSRIKHIHQLLALEGSC